MKWAILITVLLVINASPLEGKRGGGRGGGGRRRTGRRPGHGRGSSRNQSRAQEPVLMAPISGQRIRLSGQTAENMTSGTIEVYVRNQWGIICDDLWDSTGANVACKQLGFSRGAEMAAREAMFGSGQWQRSNILMDDVLCAGGETSLHHCRYENVGNCEPSEAAGVVCRHNLGCPDNWIAGPTGCYKMPNLKVTKREFAVNRCANFGGHLVNIETEEENHFLSVLFMNATNGPILTGGMKSGRSWMWEKVIRRSGSPSGVFQFSGNLPRTRRSVRGGNSRRTNSRQGGNRRTTGRSQSRFESRSRTSIQFFKWFPGFQPGNVNAEPSNKKKETCLYLSRNYIKRGKESDNVDYLFWADDICKSTRKKMKGGFKYLCERALEPVEVVTRVPQQECYEGNGVSYRGSHSQTEKGTQCIPWASVSNTNPNDYPDSGLEENYCRNPDNDSRPWCWVNTEGKYGFCPIPPCDSAAVPTDPPSQPLPTQGPTRECPEGQFYCSGSSSCISRQWKCDIEPDCPGGEDEQNCDYVLPLFQLYSNRRLENHMVKETFMGVSNETCAKLCLMREAFVCRSFNFNLLQRKCSLSEGNIQRDGMPPRVLGHGYFELLSQAEDCSDKFTCTNGRCIDPGLVCNREDNCGDLSDETECGEQEEIEVRLVDGGEHSGRIEIKYLGEWGVICDDNWDDQDAAVVCRMLGYERGTPKATVHAQFGSGNGKIFLDDVGCHGNETSLNLCSHNGWKSHNCRAHEVAGVICEFNKACDTEHYQCSSGECMPATTVCDGTCHCAGCEDERGDERGNCQVVKLTIVNGTTPTSGRVELTRNGLQGTICDDGWNDFNAQVVCRGLGFRYGKAAGFGAGTGPVWLDDVVCNGDEDSVLDCDASAWGRHNCQHSEDAGVICSNTPPQENENEVQRIRVDLMEGGSRNRGRVEIIRGGVRGTVCDDEWDDNDATVVCRMLGYRVGKAREGGFFTPGQAESVILLDDVACTGSEQSLNDCPNLNWGLHNCAHGEDAGVICLDQSQGGTGGQTGDSSGTFPYVECGRRPLDAQTRVKRNEREEEDPDWPERNLAPPPKFERIVGGFTAAEGFYPWQVGVRRHVQSGFYSHWCGGTILSEFWILTAAHCFRDLNKESILVRTGDHDNKLADDYEQEFELEHLISHRNYQQETFDFDIALIKIKPKGGHGILFNGHVQPACLPEEDTPYRTDQKCHVSGWGKTEHGYQNLLKSATVPLIDDATCARLYKDMTVNMVCAGYLAGGIDTCAGDSGGPLVCQINGKYTVMGATSYGAGCAEPNSPGVYARVTQLLPWIKSTIQRFS